MMDGDEGVEQRERPEADQRKLVGKKRIADADREKIVDQHVACRRDPKSNDVVDVKTVEGRAVDAGNRVGQDEAAKDEIHCRPDKGSDQIPERDIERRLKALPNRE